jgi:hypothetical protein
LPTRSLDFFMTFEEYSAISLDIAAKTGMHLIILRHARDYCLEIADTRRGLRAKDGTRADMVFFARGSHLLGTGAPRHLSPAEWGWATGQIPVTRDDTLYMSNIGAKSQWYDARSGRLHENMESITIFREIAPYFRRALKRPVWVFWKLPTDLDLGARPYRDIGYSNGAAEWTLQGGKLGQLGVANVRYSVTKP